MKRITGPGLRAYHRAGFVAVALAAAAAVPGAIAAQAAVDLGQFERCTGCGVALSEVAVLGDAEGAGALEGMNHRVHFGTDGEIIVIRVGGATIQFYDRDGGFRRSSGRRGGGPGEFQHIHGSQVADSSLWIADPGQSRLVRLDLEGRHLRTHAGPFGGEPFPFIVRSDGTAVFARMDGDPDRIGYPLHVVDLETRSIVKSTGSVDGRFVPGSRFETHYRNAPLPGDPDRVWLARASEPRFELWNLETGEHERTMSGMFAWFPKPEHDFDGRSDPPAQLLEFLFDDEDRLWMLTQVPNPRWRDFVELTPGGEHAFRMLDPDPANLWDVRVDVFDPGTGQHFEGPRWNELGVGMVAHEGGVHLFRTVLDEESLSVRLHLYQAEPTEVGATGR